MKKTLTIATALFIALALAGGTALAQAERNEGERPSAKPWNYESSLVSFRLDDKLADMDASDWGGFGGPMLTYLWLDPGAFDPMTEDRDVDAFDSGILLVGGYGGAIYKNFRFGGFGFGNNLETSDRVGGKRRSAEISIGGGGVFLEYNASTLPNAGVSLGTMLGAGNMTFEASGNDLGGGGDWDASESFFMAYPYVGLWAGPAEWMWVELDAGYLFFNIDTGGSTWENDLGQDMIDGDINGGWQAALKVGFGLNPNAN